MSDPDKTIPLRPTGSNPNGGPGLRRVTVLASAAGAAIVAVLLGAIVAFQSSDNVLSPEEVSQRLAADGASATPTDEPSALPPALTVVPSGTPWPVGTRVTPSMLDTVAATIALTCVDTRLLQATWTIKPGYRLDERTQTVTSLRLWIESDVHDDVTITAVCPAKVSVSAEADDHGGGGDDDGGGDDHGGDGGGGKGRG